jgi:thioredoxin 1
MKQFATALFALAALSGSAQVNADKMDDKMAMKKMAANQVRPFSTAALNAAKQAGSPIVVAVHADWCPVCRAQAPIVAQLAADPANAKVVFFRLNFDSQRSERAALRAASQSILIGFKGQREVARTQGVTDAGKIGMLVAATRS